MKILYLGVVGWLAGWLAGWAASWPTGQRAQSLAAGKRWYILVPVMHSNALSVELALSFNFVAVPSYRCYNLPASQLRSLLKGKIVRAPPLHNP